MNTDLAELFRQQKIIKDRVRGVFYQQLTGMYLHGRPGTSKTHTVLETLDNLLAPYAYSNGHVTPRGLFELIADNCDRVIVMDDLSSIFNQPIAMQILLGALGNRNGGEEKRKVIYQKAKSREVITFTGGIVGISNLALNDHTKEIRRALADRVQTMSYDPTDEQILALMSHIAKQGTPELTAEECYTVMHFMIGQMKGRDLRPTIRMFVDKALKDYTLWKMGKTETHWQDLVISSLEQQVVELTMDTNDLSKTEEIEAQMRLALQIHQTIETKEERITVWFDQTGKSQPTYYRRIQALQKEGEL